MQQLLQRIQQEGDQSAFRELFLSIAPRLLTFASIYVKNRFVAEEIVDNVFLHLWNNRGTINEILDLNAYLYSSVRNRIYNYFNRDRERKNVDIDALADVYLKITVDPEQIFITTELQNFLEKSINNLPVRCKLIFKMIKEDGLKHKEVANILNISPKTVENQLAIAIRKIKEEVLSSFPEDEIFWSQFHS